jgi:hypothetical protein
MVQIAINLVQRQFQSVKSLIYQVIKR